MDDLTQLEEPTMPTPRPTPTADEHSLLAAARDGDLPKVQSLITQGVNVNAHSKDFAPPLVGLISAAANTTSLVMHNGKLVPSGQILWEQKDLLIQVIRELLAAGANPNGTAGKSPLLALAWRIPDDVRLPIAHLLLKSGANPDASDKTGTSPLLAAVLYRSTAYARLLLEQPVDVNRTAPRGAILNIAEDNLASARKDLASAGKAANRYQQETNLQQLEQLVQDLKSRGARHKSELAVPPEKTKPQPRHVASDFLDLANAGEAEWALLAIKAPFEAACDAYFKFSKSKFRTPNVPLHPAADGEEIPPYAAVVKVKDSPWTLILCSIFYVRAADLKHAASAAKHLSAALQTRALTYTGTEETEIGRCELFENGQSISKGSGKKAIALLSQENIALPAFYPARKGSDLWLSIEKPSLGAVLQADLIALDKK